MLAQESLKQIERRAYRSTFSDGLYDILIGMWLLILAWLPVLELAGIPKIWGYFLGLLPVFACWLGKRYVTIPRLGRVEFGTKRRSHRRFLLLVGAAIIFLMMPVLFMVMGKGLPVGLGGNLGSAPVIALVAAPIMIVAAYFLDFPRLYIYAAAMMLAIPHAVLMNTAVDQPLNSLLSFGITGTAIVVYGLLLLVRFLKSYSNQNVEVGHVSR